MKKNKKSIEEKKNYISKFIKQKKRNSINNEKIKINEIK